MVGGPDRLSREAQDLQPACSDFQKNKRTSGAPRRRCNRSTTWCALSQRRLETGRLPGAHLAPVVSQKLSCLLIRTLCFGNDGCVKMLYSAVDSALSCCSGAGNAMVSCKITCCPQIDSAALATSSARSSISFAQRNSSARMPGVFQALRTQLNRAGTVQQCIMVLCEGTHRLTYPILSYPCRGRGCLAGAEILCPCFDQTTETIHRTSLKIMPQCLRIRQFGETPLLPRRPAQRQHVYNSQQLRQGCLPSALGLLRRWRKLAR